MYTAMHRASELQTDNCQERTRVETVSSNDTDTLVLREEEAEEVELEDVRTGRRDAFGKEGGGIDHEKESQGGRQT